ncbi:MAG: stage III sporulation protein AE [Lachnospiraceae bacterium]|nr:stage III sporulation protein AE [Lachnospiraceae bacterium]
MEELELDYTELEQVVENLLPGNFPLSFEELVSRLVHGEMEGLGEVLKEIGSWLLQSVAFPAEHGLRLFFLIIFSALFSNLSKAFSREGTSHIGFLCVYLLMAVHAAAGFSSSLNTAAEGMENLSGFVTVLLPMYCISIGVVNGSVTAAGYYQGTVFLLGFFEFLARYCLLPLAQVYIMLSFASCMQKKPVFDKLLELIVSLFTWIKKTLLGIALAMGAVQGILCPAIDGLKRTAVVQSASAIPGVGNLIGGAWETVLGAGAVLKNAVGLVGVLFLFLVVSLPLVKLAMHYLVYRVLAAVTEPVTQEMTEQFLQHVGTAQKLLLQTLCLGVMLFLLMLVVMTRITA